MKTMIMQKWPLIVAILGAAVTAMGACYAIGILACGPATLSELHGLSPAVLYTCTDPGDSNPSWRNVGPSEKGWDQLQYIDYECTYACLGWDATGTSSWWLPADPPSEYDHTTGNLTPFGNVCYGGAGGG